jgi:hypothetical protein
MNAKGHPKLNPVGSRKGTVAFKGSVLPTVICVSALELPDSIFLLNVRLLALRHV